MIKIKSHEIIVFVDLDGTLVETDLANKLAYEKAIKCVLGRTVFIDNNVRVDRDVLRKNLKTIDSKLIEEIVKKKESYFSFFLPKTKLKKDTYDFLAKARETSRIILVSKCREKRARSVLHYHGIEDLFSDFYFLGQQIDSDFSNKYEGALREFKVDPSKVTVIENEELEIKAAIDSGIIESKIFKVI